jgi:hypothetical protein
LPRFPPTSDPTPGAVRILAGFQADFSIDGEFTGEVEVPTKLQDDAEYF